jgi:predicted RND superfamily exporter protein
MRYGEFHPTVIQLIDQINEATKNLSGRLSLKLSNRTASVKIIEQATSNGQPTGKSRRIIFAVAFLVSVFISFGLAIVKGLFDWTIKTPQDIADYLDIPCIGSIPKKQWSDKYLVTDSSKSTRYYQFYEELAEQIPVFLKTQGIKSAVIISPIGNKNHKFIVPNLGYFLTRLMGSRVLLVDLNFNKPQFQKIYSLKSDTGIDAESNNPVSIELVNKTENGPDLLPAKTSANKTSIVLKDTEFKKFIEHHKNEYDAVFLDATSINNMKEASALTQICDGILLIIDEGKLQRKMLKNSLPRF